MLTKFNEQAQKAIVIAESIAFDLGHNNVGSEHLLLSLLKMSDSKLKVLLQEYDVDDKKIYTDIKRLFGENDDQPFYMEYSDVVKELLDSAVIMTKNRGKNKVTLSILTIAMLQTKESVALELLKKYHVDIEAIIIKLKENSELESKLDQIPSMINMNKKVKKEAYNVVGRDKEIEQLCMILCKKEKNNALLVGAAGVGKSALIEKLARKINAKEVPEELQGRLVYELSLAGLVAGTKYRGEFEEKLRKIIDRIKEVQNVIVFIDEIHNIIGAGGAEGAIDASNILKPYLARKDITVIGATTLDEYYKYFEKDQAMNRRFSLIMLKENTKEETLQILYDVKQYYEDFHQIVIPSSVLQYLVEQVDIYVRNRTFPDKAIDVLDLSCVKTKFKNNKTLDIDIVKAVIEEYASIVIEESINFETIEKRLKQKVVGQNKPIETMIKRLQIRKRNTKQPEGVFLFMGNSGVGKTKLAKELSECLHRPLIRMDMTEYKSSASMQKIIGSPPGYIGYDSPSLLLPKLLENPKSILLLDEIEKAHSDVLNIFLQVFDEGYLEDNQKRKVYFDNTIIIMTSNAGSQYSTLGFKKNLLKKPQAKMLFSNEFISRIDEVIPFNRLTPEYLKMIMKMYSHGELEEETMESILASYDSTTGARGIIREVDRYLMDKNYGLGQR